MKTKDIKCVEKTPEVTTAERDTVLRFTRLCMRELSKKKYGLPPMDGSKLAVSLSGEKNCSEGGEDGILISLYWYRKQADDFPEYKMYAKDPLIGSVKGATPDIALFCLVAHEVAHHVQFKYANKCDRYSHLNPHNHNELFREFYRILRTILINPLIEKKI